MLSLVCLNYLSLNFVEDTDIGGNVERTLNKIPNYISGFSSRNFLLKPILFNFLMN